MIYCKSRQELLLMDRANRIVLRVLDELKQLVKPGVTTLELENYAAEQLKGENARPAFLGYRGFPAVLCTSLNEQVVHGIPSGRKMKEGDILSIDFGVEYEGYFGDGAVTIPVGEVDPEVRRLVKVTRQALDRAVSALLGV